MIAAEKKQQADGLFELTERPEWVTERPTPAPAASETGEHESPKTYLLLDFQTLVNSAGNSSYRRLCYQINDASCIEDMSQFLYSVRPESQRMSFHRCVIYRDDKTIDCLDVENIRCMQRELQLERHVSSDVMTVEFIIDDLRTGDIVDIETSEHEFKSDHPLIGHFIREDRSLTFRTFVGQQFIRVVNQSDSNLTVQHLDSKNKINDVTTVTPNSDFEHKSEQLKPATFDGNLPAEYWPPHLFTTTEISWEKTSAHMHSFYRQAGVFDPVEFEELEIAEVSEKTILNNIRFVQDNIRYRSDCNGIFTHTPKQASKTLKKRTGDCKDKSTLLLSILKAMGIEANLALVDTCLEDGIETLMPSPFLFDHMIVHFVWQGNDYFVDATTQKQGGTLATMAQLTYKSALILKAEGGGLKSIPYNKDRVVYTLTQKFDLSLTNESKPVVTYRRDYYGARADNMRYYFGSNELKSIQTSYYEGLAQQLEAKLTPVSSMVIVNDDTQLNHLTTEESYLIETPLAEIDNGHIILATPFYQELEISSTSTSPEELHLDGEVQQHIIITYPCKPGLDDDSFESNNQWFDYRETATCTDNEIKMTVTMKPKSSRIEAEQREEYLELVDALQKRSLSQFPSEIADTTQLAVEFLAIGAAVFTATLAAADKIPGSAGLYLIGIYGLYKLYTAITAPKK